MLMVCPWPPLCDGWCQIRTTDGMLMVCPCTRVMAGAICTKDGVLMVCPWPRLRDGWCQIRNVASVGGNVCTASPISDLNPIWMASRAVFRLAAASKDGGPPVTREVPAESFFLGYRKVDLLPGEVMTSVFLPWSVPTALITIADVNTTQ